MSNGNGPGRRLPNLLLQEERLHRGWTQQEVADRVGTTVVNVSRWERGATSPNPYFRQQLCLAFETDAGTLGLVPNRGTAPDETELPSVAVPLDLSETALVNPVHPPVFLSPLQRSLGPRRMVWMIISIALVILIIGSSVLIITMRSNRPLVLKVIGKDTFQRANQAGWGTASDGQKWAGDANTLPNFSIVGKMAHLDATKTGTVYNALLGPAVSDAEVTMSGTISSFDSSNLGSVLRWHDTNTWYKVYIDGHSLVIRKDVAGQLTYPAVTTFKAETGASYTLRFRAVGTHLSAKVWLTSNSEPEKWMAEVDDNALSSGYCGVRIQVTSDATSTVTSFEAKQIS